ncbi:MAG TPA: hypothetical protein VGX27_12400 [Candidatus Dormibacteraeota bacterium]|nr:hypothetical protein [Candidatus Dormibacteraeota bacterium]
MKLPDDLALAIVGAQLSSYVSAAVLLAVFWRHQRTWRGFEPVAITVTELCDVTGYRRSWIYEALRELKDRRIVTVRQGGGRGHPSAYQVADHRSWIPPKQSTGSGHISKESVHAVADGFAPETVHSPSSRSAPPLSIPPGEIRNGEVEEVERPRGLERKQHASVAGNARSFFTQQQEPERG